MKNFFSSFFASLLALVVFLAGALALGFILLLALAATGEKPVEVQKGSYLVFDFTGSIQDAPEQMEGIEQLVEALGGGRAAKRMQLRAVVRALQAAAKDDDIAGLYLTGSFVPQGYGSGYATLKEVREAVEAFRASGKPVRGYFQNFMTTRDLYVASAATELVMDPYSAMMFTGLASQPMFLAGAFEKLGIGVQVTRVGKYKSAVEPYTRKDMSPENRAQVQKLLDDVWGELATTVEKARALGTGELQKIVDRDGLIRAEDALAAKLIDRVAYYDEVQAELKKATDVKGTKSFKQIALKSYAKLVTGSGAEARRAGTGGLELGVGSKGRIAVVYAEGTIVDGDGKEEGVVWGDGFAREIRRLRQDEAVKAIVLRVNSPGGSASASEQMLRELRLAQAVKPVVVSMGTVAASGGYWISTAANRVFAEPTTITGSIGVFGMFLNFEELTKEKLGITFDTVKTGKFADALSVARPKTEDELAMFQKLVDWIYDQFLTRVVEARKLTRDQVHEIAQGRVWSGTEALKLGLVDELGGLAAATRFAAGAAGLAGSYTISEFPQKKQFAEALAESLGGHRRDANAGAGPMQGLLTQLREQWEVLAQFNDPKGLYARLPFDLALQ